MQPQPLSREEAKALLEELKLTETESYNRIIQRLKQLKGQK